MLKGYNGARVVPGYYIEMIFSAFPSRGSKARSLDVRQFEVGHINHHVEQFGKLSFLGHEFRRALSLEQPAPYILLFKFLEFLDTCCLPASVMLC